MATKGSSALEPVAMGRVEFRFAEYLVFRFERRNVFSVISSGEKGGIMFGYNPNGPARYGAGWPPVLSNGQRMFAKFAKVAINVLKDEPSDSQEVPNRLTEMLEEMFGLGGYLPGRGNKVWISEDTEQPGTWTIEPFARTSRASRALS